MEAVAIHLKESGSYMCRQISTKGVSHRIELVPLTPEFEQLYTECTVLVC